jgi:small subunit ribosomal protein S17
VAENETPEEEGAVAEAAADAADAAADAPADETTPVEPEAVTELEPETAPELAEAEGDPSSPEPELEAEQAAAPPTAADAEPEPEPEPEAAEPAAAAAPAPAAEAAPRRPRAPRPKPAKKAPAVAKQRGTYHREPRPEKTEGIRKERRGVVVSSAGEKSITVRIDTAHPHPKYGKIVRRSSKLHAHDERNEAKVGDVVRVVECRPLSKTKRWRLVEIVEVAR